jgi:glyoxylase-like metal-dependent hydrolase (beta-lactamase superfamily II)
LDKLTSDLYAKLHQPISEGTAVRITDDVYMLDCTPASHAYLLVGPEIMLVDTSIPGSAPKILREISALKIDPRAVRHILLTHHDGDHVGSAAVLQQATGADVWASAGDIPFILGTKRRPGIKLLASTLMRPKVPTVLRTYPADNRLGEVEVIPTPGHTPGHVCLLYRNVLLAGDLVTVQRGLVRPSPATMTWDSALVKESIRKAAPLAFKWVCPAHGLPVERGDQWEKIA